MAEYYSKMTKHISKMTEHCSKMADSNHKMVELCGSVGCTWPHAGSGDWSTWGRRDRSMQGQSGVGWTSQLVGLSR
jgi:hypothetical protein